MSRPLTESEWSVISILGLLVYGATGFIDASDGMAFPKLKAVSLIGAAVAALYWWRQRRTRRRKHHLAGSETSGKGPQR